MKLVLGGIFGGCKGVKRPLRKNSSMEKNETASIPDEKSRHCLGTQQESWKKMAYLGKGAPPFRSHFRQKKVYLPLS